MFLKTYPLWIFMVALIFCEGAKSAEFKPPQTVFIPAGTFIMGSNSKERNAAYDLDEAAYGHPTTRKGRWYEGEGPRRVITTQSYEITRTPITNADYDDFVTETHYLAPTVDRKTWKSYGLAHPYKTAQRYIWIKKSPPPGRENHPVVLVSYEDAVAYAGWLSLKTKQNWRLPTEKEWEKAMRGTDGRAFPWGDIFDPTALNSHDKGPFDTLPVGSFANGASPYGVLDGAGQVFEWTADTAGKNRIIVKGGSWDDRGCGICRPAARHSRPLNLKHILIGFRLVRDLHVP